MPDWFSDESGAPGISGRNIYPVVPPTFSLDVQNSVGSIVDNVELSHVSPEVGL
jgi:hypothetical protein